MSMANHRTETIVDREDCKAKFKAAWARKCIGLTDRAITKARELQLADELESAPVPARFG